MTTMRLIDVFAAYDRGDLTLEDAAEALGLEVRDFKFRLSRWGLRLPLLLNTLDKLKEGKVTRDQAAEALSVSTRQVNQLMNTWEVKKPVKEYLVHNTAVQIKWEIRKKYAIDYIAGSSTIEEAADNAEISARQMRRWVSELLNKHYQIPFKDLVKVTSERRRHMATEIEEAEGLEIAKQNVLRAISTGKKDLTDAAIERVLHSKPRREAHV